MLRVNDFWYQYCVASNQNEDGTVIHTVGVVTMDGADLAYSKDFDTMTEAIVFRTSVQAAMANGVPLADVVGIDVLSLPADIRAYEDKRLVWYTNRRVGI